MNYLAIDLEMTGLNVKKDRILEIGAVHMENGQPRETFSALIHPHCDLSDTIIQLTGITQQMAQQGEELSAVLPRFLAFAGELPLLGHNLRYDYSFLMQACVNAELPFERSCIDTLKLARRFLPAEQSKKLTDLRQLYSLDTGAVHRAASDAYAAALVYERLSADFYDRAPEAFAPAPMQMRLKKQQPITIPQKEQLLRLLPNTSAGQGSVDLDHLTRSEASRLIERLLRPEHSE